MAYINGFNDRIVASVHANEHGSRKNNSLFLYVAKEADVAQSAGAGEVQNEETCEAVGTALQLISTGKVTSVSHAAARNYVEFRDNDLPEADESITAIAVAVDANGTSRRFTFPFVKPGTTRQDIVDFLLANYNGRTFRTGPTNAAGALVAVVAVDFKVRG